MRRESSRGLLGVLSVRISSGPSVFSDSWELCLSLRVVPLFAARPVWALAASKSLPQDSHHQTLMFLLAAPAGLVQLGQRVRMQLLRLGVLQKFPRESYQSPTPLASCPAGAEEEVHVRSH